VDGKDNKQIGISEANLNRAISWSSVADQKAGFVLTLTIVMLGFLTSQLNDFFTAVFALWEKSASAPVLFTILIAVLLLALIGMIGAIVNLVSVIRPRVTPSSAKNSILFFQTICAMPIDEFTDRVKQMDEESYVHALCDQTHNVSKVVAEKFRKLAFSIKWFWVGVAAVGLFSFLRPLFIKLLER
jgi:hypothetical protein